MADWPCADYVGAGAARQVCFVKFFTKSDSGVNLLIFKGIWSMKLEGVEELELLG